MDQRNHQESPQEPLVLLVTNEPDELAALSRLLIDAGYPRQHVAREASEACDLIAASPPSLILAEYDADAWMKILHAAQRHNPSPKLILGLRFSQLQSPEADILVKAGAFTVIGRPYCASEVNQALGFATQVWAREREQVEEARNQPAHVAIMRHRKPSHSAKRIEVPNPERALGRSVRNVG